MKLIPRCPRTEQGFPGRRKMADAVENFSGRKKIYNLSSCESYYVNIRQRLLYVWGFDSYFTVLFSFSVALNYHWRIWIFVNVAASRESGYYQLLATKYHFPILFEVSLGVLNSLCYQITEITICTSANNSITLDRVSCGLQ